MPNDSFEAVFMNARYAATVAHYPSLEPIADPEELLKKSLDLLDEKVRSVFFIYDVLIIIGHSSC